MSAQRELLKIGEFARAGETNLRTLRYYEELGLLMPASRTNGGIRFYRSTDLNRLRMIGELQSLGLNLETIHDLLSTRCGEDRAAYLDRVGHALREQDSLLTQKMDGLDEQRRTIRLALAKITECGTCEHTPDASNNFCEPCRVTGEVLPAALSALF